MLSIPAVRERCAGIDVGKRTLAVALIKGPADQDGELTTKEFGTTVPQLTALRSWLVQEGCTSVAMESTGSYWIPVKNELEGTLELILVCSQKHKPKKGEKTDFRDAQNLAHLHRHGLLTPSYLPEKGIIELRDLTRRRKKLLGNLASEKNRIQKVLEVANVKIGNVVSDVFGISGQQIVSVLLSAKEVEAAQIADLAKGRLRQKLPELTETLQGHHMNEHHRWLIEKSIEHIVLLDRQLEELEDKIQEKVQPYREPYELLQTIPGVKEMTAASILAEIGADMSVFESSRHLTSWAGICPGNNRSAGKSKSSRIKKGNKFLIAALVQAAWGAVKKQGSLFQKSFHRWRGRIGKKKANIAICCKLLSVAYVILKEKRPYRESVSEPVQERERAKQIHHHAKRLRQLGAAEEDVRQITEKLLAEKPAVAASEPAVPATRSRIEPTAVEADGAAPERARCKPPICRGALGFRARQAREQPSRKATKATKATGRAKVGAVPQPASTTEPVSKTKRQTKAKNAPAPVVERPGPEQAAKVPGKHEQNTGNIKLSKIKRNAPSSTRKATGTKRRLKPSSQASP